ncbi:MAG: riboflavin synthase [Gammaproteobacteria bacterium]
MFTGIIKSVGKLAGMSSADDIIRLEVQADGLNTSDRNVGDSIAVNGVCLTATSWDDDSFKADLSTETLDKTTLGDRKLGDQLNLEPALTLADPLGGHLVSGHVDGVGEVAEITFLGEASIFKFSLPEELSRYVAKKGSVCIDGVSLTVNEVEGNRFAVTIIPHTMDNTVFGDYVVGTRVNIEVDMIARYLERIVQYTASQG